MHSVTQCHSYWARVPPRQLCSHKLASRLINAFNLQHISQVLFLLSTRNSTAFWRRSGHRTRSLDQGAHSRTAVCNVVEVWNGLQVSNTICNNIMYVPMYILLVRRCINFIKFYRFLSLKGLKAAGWIANNDECSLKREHVITGKLAKWGHVGTFSNTVISRSTTCSRMGSINMQKSLHRYCGQRCPSRHNLMALVRVYPPDRYVWVYLI